MRGRRRNNGVVLSHVDKRILKTLAKPHSLRELMTRLDHPRNYLYTRLRRLTANDLVTVTGTRVNINSKNVQIYAATGKGSEALLRAGTEGIMV